MGVNLMKPGNKNKKNTPEGVLLLFGAGNGNRLHFSLREK